MQPQSTSSFSRWIAVILLVIFGIIACATNIWAGILIILGGVAFMPIWYTALNNQLLSKGQSTIWSLALASVASLVLSSIGLFVLTSSQSTTSNSIPDVSNNTPTSNIPTPTVINPSNGTRIGISSVEGNNLTGAETVASEGGNKGNNATSNNSTNNNTTNNNTTSNNVTSGRNNTTQNNNTSRNTVFNDVITNIPNFDDIPIIDDGEIPPIVVDDPIPPPTQDPSTPSTPGSRPPVQPGLVKKARNGICYYPGSSKYDLVTQYISYENVESCIQSGGTLPND